MSVVSAFETGEDIEVWRQGATTAALIADLGTRVHVWQVTLGNLSERSAAGLSDDERLRAARFARPEDRRRYVTVRGVLRDLLAALRGTGETRAASRLRFGYGPAGKPFLADDPGLRFNVSHSDGRAVIAVTRAGEVGIDVERRRTLRDMDGVARLTFTAAEREMLLNCHPSVREAVFYTIWTGKEALLKAMGIGIAALDDPDDLSLARAGAGWEVIPLRMPDAFAAALAQPRGTRAPRVWSLPDRRHAGTE